MLYLNAFSPVLYNNIESLHKVIKVENDIKTTIQPQTKQKC